MSYKHVWEARLENIHAGYFRHLKAVVTVVVSYVIFKYQHNRLTV